MTAATAEGAAFESLLRDDLDAVSQILGSLTKRELYALGAKAAELSDLALRAYSTVTLPPADERSIVNAAAHRASE